MNMLIHQAGIGRQCPKLMRTEVEVHCLEMDKKQLNDLVSVYFWKLTLETLIILIRNGEASGMQKKKSSKKGPEN